ncbi:unnamed protein product [Linum trigynum]|uniref:Reverse transcriptase zinc-binding domain-containing protein n=1 Tax=Linum trigynum TaxID=586398 RepID=A0AAV2E104_9ROSI
MAIKEPPEEPEPDEVEDGAGEADEVNWKILWQTNCPPKIRIFLCRIMHNILPTNVNLAKKMEDRLVKDCPYCGMEETIHHRFLECQWSLRMWQSSLWCDRYNYADGESMEKWLNHVITTANPDTAGGISSLLWLLWNERNNRQLNGERLDEAVIAQKA